MASGSKFVQITKEIVNIRAITDPTEAEDNETVHGFIENRTVFGASGELVQYRHWPSVQKYLRQSYISKCHCDVKYAFCCFIFRGLLNACNQFQNFSIGRESTREIIRLRYV